MTAGAAAPFAIADALPDAGPERGPWVLSDATGVWQAAALDEVVPVLRAAEDAARAGAHVAGVVAYEAAPAFDPALAVRAAEPGSAGDVVPLAWFAAFGRVAPLGDEAALDRFVGARAVDDAALDRVRWIPECDAAAYAAAVAASRDAIAGGDFYQVNHTLRLAADGDVDPLALWRRLRAAQLGAPRLGAPGLGGAPRGAAPGHALYLDAGPWQVACASPELFFSRRGDRVTARPMKGTAPRGRWPEEDRARRLALIDSAKERAENVMIVDLVRNDLARIAEPGSVEVPALFDVECYPGVWQLTSTVCARARSGVGLAELFAALFPCGSITGAPKVAAARRIAAVERSARGPYCGAAGVLAPGPTAAHCDATFAVGIRTAWRDAGWRDAGRGRAWYGAGGGVTWDSDPDAEWREATLKAGILTTPPRPAFSLVETLRYEPRRSADADAALVGYARLDRHLARLASSAEYFGFADPRADALRALRAVAAALAGETGRWRVRLVAHADGRAEATRALLPADASRVRTATLARTPVDRDDLFLHHKTTHRAAYDVRRAERTHVDDVLLFNREGELTEFTIGSLVVELAGRRWTPPRACGLLGGVFRAELLERGLVAERVLRVADMTDAGAGPPRVWLVNSLREWVPVALVERP